MYVKFFKRLLDIFFAVLFLIILIPFIFIPVSIILLFTGEHEVFYKQNRVGYKNQFFKIWKFATMVKNSSKIGTGSLTLRNDPRVLPFGKFLRKTKINEVPQIINVIIGNMSFIGARPQMEVDFLKFSENVQEVIYNTPPGITGAGSILFRDEEEWISNAPGDKHDFYKTHIAPYKGDLELWYQHNISLATDIKLFFITVWVVFRPKSTIIYNVFKDIPKKPEELKY